jgi:hypothetical protein
MARELSDLLDLVRFGSHSGSTRIKKNVMNSGRRVRTSLGKNQPIGTQQMPTRNESASFGLLETLSPEMAKDLGDAFSLARIGTSRARTAPTESNEAARGALRFAGRLAVFLLVAVVAVSITLTAMYLIPLG